MPVRLFVRVCMRVWVSISVFLDVCLCLLEFYFGSSFTVHSLFKFQLKKRGYTRVDALDGSEGMLRQAKVKGIYNNYIHAFVGPQPIAGIEKGMCFYSFQWRIQDFSQEAPTPEGAPGNLPIFPRHYMKMTKFWSIGSVPWAPRSATGFCILYIISFCSVSSHGRPN